MRTLLVDLDGTLIDPGPGIVGAFQYALRSLGSSVPERADLGWIIGPSLRDSFRSLLGATADVAEALRLYREHYAAGGLFNAATYRGIADALDLLRASDTTMLVCTAKPTVFATQIISHFGLDNYFSAVYGAELDGKYDQKQDLISHILDVEGINPEETCMVGDRKHDVIAAAAHGIPTVGVLWGYGSREELELAGAAHIVCHPNQLYSAINSVDRSFN